MIFGDDYSSTGVSMCLAVHARRLSPISVEVSHVQNKISGSALAVAGYMLWGPE